MKKQYSNYVRNKKNKFQDKLNYFEESLKNTAKTKEYIKETYGKYSELITLGEVERLEGISPRVIKDEEMKTSYEYGFYIKGSRVLAGEFEKEMFSEEEQRYYGIIDLNNGVKDEHLETLKNYPHYINGRIYQMGRNIYNYIEENGLTIEEYINIMSIINPYLLNQEFKNGYYKQKAEIEETKKRK